MNKLERDGIQNSEDVGNRQGVLVLSLWLVSAVIAVACFAPLAANWMDQSKSASAPVLLNWSLSGLLVAGGVFFAAREWDWVVRLSTSKWVWGAAVLGLLTLVASPLFAQPKLVPIGLFFLLSGFFASQQSRVDASWLFRFAFIAVPFLTLPSAWKANWFQEAANVLASGIAGTLTWLRIPVSVVESSLLLETHTVELATLPLAGALQVTMLMTALWVAAKRRSLLALPAYMLTGLLWCFGVVAAQGFLLVWKPALSPVELVVGTVAAYLLAALMVLSTDRGLRVLLFEIPNEVEGRKTNPMLVAWNKCFHAMTFSKPTGSSAAT